VGVEKVKRGKTVGRFRGREGLDKRRYLMASTEGVI
jgi:hypothetical protein